MRIIQFNKVLCELKKNCYAQNLMAGRGAKKGESLAGGEENWQKQQKIFFTSSGGVYDKKKLYYECKREKGIHRKSRRTGKRRRKIYNSIYSWRQAFGINEQHRLSRLGERERVFVCSAN